MAKIKCFLKQKLLFILEDKDAFWRLNVSKLVVPLFLFNDSIEIKFSLNSRRSSIKKSTITEKKKFSVELFCRHGWKVACIW